MTEIILKKVSDIKVIEKLYPRSKLNTKLIEQYAETVDSLPPIEINQNNILIDGAHRLSAYKQEKLEEISCTITNTSTDQELLLLAIERNAIGKYQLTNEDKKRHATTLCGEISEEEITKRLAISERTYRLWTATKRKQLDENRNSKVIDLWMQCYTQEQIAEEVIGDITKRTTITTIIDKYVKNGIYANSDIPKDFTPQLYNIWNFVKNNNETKHFGNIPVEIIENLLYYYTKPFDIVFDPFGGGGITIDACKKWYRRYYVSDISPVEIALQKGMRVHDITTGLPEDLPRPNFVFLDPPYWLQGKGQYTEMSSDLSNMSLDDFYKTFTILFGMLYKKIADNGYMAFIIQNTQWLNTNKKQEPHSHKLWNIASANGFEFESIVHVPYSSQQYNAQQVDYAKEHKIFLELNRELVIFKKK